MEIHRDRKTVSPDLPPFYLSRMRPSLFLAVSFPHSLAHAHSFLLSRSLCPPLSLPLCVFLSRSSFSLTSFFLAAATAFGKTHRISQPGSLLDHQRGMSTTSGRPAESLPRQRVSIDLLVRESVNGSEAERAGDPRDRRRDATRRAASHRTAPRRAKSRSRSRSHSRTRRVSAHAHRC